MVAVSAFETGRDAQAGSDTNAHTGSGAPSQYVQLNVGGKTFCTTLDTLCRDSHSMLAAMFSGRYARPAGAVVFIDRDGDRFRHVLNYLRGGTLHLAFERSTYTALLEEADYYGLSGMRELIHEELVRMDEMEQARAKHAQYRAAGAVATRDSEHAIFNQWAGGMPGLKGSKLGSPSLLSKRTQRGRIDELASCLYQAAVNLVAMQHQITINDFRTDVDF